jgi:Leucine-rich repeat (LRR) protein
LTEVVSIDLSDNSLEDDIPPVFSSLPALIAFDVERNLLQGDPFSTDVDVFSSSSLRALKISSNFFTGTIPEEISNLNELEMLWFAENRFTGEIPPEIGSLTALSTSDHDGMNSPVVPCARNRRSCCFSCFTGSLFGYFNRLEGPLPSEMGLLALEELQIFGNGFTGTIPEELFNNVGMTLLRLDINSFDGPLPSNLGDLIDLKELWLNNNTLTGSIPVTLVKLSNLG